LTLAHLQLPLNPASLPFRTIDIQSCHKVVRVKTIFSLSIFFSPEMYGDTRLSKGLWVTALVRSQVANRVYYTASENGAGKSEAQIQNSMRTQKLSGHSKKKKLCFLV